MPTTQAQLENIYNNSIIAENPNLVPSLQQGQDLYFKRKGITQVVSTATQENSIIGNNIFPVSSSSVFLYKHVSNLGMPLVQGALPSYGTVTLIPTTGITSPVTFMILAGAILSNPITNIQYEVTQTTTISSGADFANIAIPIQSVLSGSQTYSPPDTILNFSTPFVLSDTVTVGTASMNNDQVSGQDLPTDSQVSNSVYNFMQTPRGGGSLGDYKKWALESSSLITNAIIIPSGGLDANPDFILVAIMGGSSDPFVNTHHTKVISKGCWIYDL